MAESESRVVMIAVDASAQADEAFEWYLSNMARDSDDVKVVNCAEFHLDLSVGGQFLFEFLKNYLKRYHDIENKIAQVEHL